MKNVASISVLIFWLLIAVNQAVAAGGIADVLQQYSILPPVPAGDASTFPLLDLGYLGLYVQPPVTGALPPFAPANLDFLYSVQRASSRWMALQTIKDVNDHIVLLPSGNVGIITPPMPSGLPWWAFPRAKLHVASLVKTSVVSPMFLLEEGPQSAPTASDGPEPTALDEIGSQTPLSALAEPEPTPEPLAGTPYGYLMAYFGDGLSHFDSYGDYTFGFGGTEQARITRTGNVGIGTPSPACRLDIAGAVNLNKGTGTAPAIALTVDGKEALWSNGTYFSWGYGGSWNYFKNSIGIGTTSPQQALDLGSATSGRAIVWGGPSGTGWYDTIGASYSSAALSLLFMLKTDTTKDQYLVSYTGNEPHAGIRIGDGIHFFAEPSTTRTAGTVFDYAAATRLSIKDDGNVGIGTTTPRSTLEVHSSGAAAVFSTFATGGGSLGWGTQGIGLNLVRKPTGTWEAEGDSANNGGAAIFGAIGPEGLRFVTVESTGGANQTLTDAQIMGKVRMVIRSNGNAGIGTTSPTEKLDVDGTARLRQIAAGSGTPVVADTNGKLWKQSSSKKYKTDIRDLETHSDAVLNLRPVQFQWKTTGQQDTGLIAEEVAEVLGDLVIDDAEGRPEAVKYDKVALYLLSVVKAQQQRIAQLEAAQAQNTSLARRIEALERLARQQKPGTMEGQQ